MNLKNVLKTIKLYENQLSTILGILILLAAAFFVIRYVKNLRNPSATPTPQVEANQNQTHAISKGETLWSIAEKYLGNGSDWKKIADANNIKKPTQIEVGQTLIIPQSGNTSVVKPTPTESTKPTPTSSPTGQITQEAASTTSEIKDNTYTVVKGDNLWKIALRAYGNGNKWHDIAQANHLSNPRVIHAGNVFTIPR